MMDREYTMIMPNHIVVKDGLACGDKITLLYDFEDGIMDFQILSEGCSVCTKMCHYLQKELNHKKIEDILEQSERWLKDSNLEKEIFGESFLLSRRECYRAPVRILKESAGDFKAEKQTISNNRINLYVDKMDCDACATRENVSWLYQKPTHIHGQYHISDKNRRLLMKLGRLSLKDIDIKQVSELYDSLSDDEFEFMEEYKLLPMVYQNLKKLKIINEKDQRWRLLIYQRQRTIVAQSEIEQLNEYIQSKKAYWIKGAFTRDLYKEKSMRNLTDFDLLAIEEEDAYDIIEWLIRHDYKIFPDSFSLKKSLQNGKEVYTGHLHFQKVLNLQFRMIVDINFTGFPMIKVASYVPKIRENRIALESMIVVTLCHLFKHKEVFMKDINDLYLMLIDERLNVEILSEELNKNGLKDLFLIVLDFINREYEVPAEAVYFYKLQEKFRNEMVLLSQNGDWPYVYEDVKRVKEREFLKFTKDKVDMERLYLYPIIIFKEKQNIGEIVQDILKKEEKIFRNIKKLTEHLYEVEIDDFYLIISSIGYFLEMKEYYNESMKKNIRRRMKQLLQLKKTDYIAIPYAIAFKEKWLDTDKE